MIDRHLFPVVERHIWMNHAAISPWPGPVIDAMRGFVEQNATAGPIHYPEWLRTEQRLRDRAAELLGAGVEDIALLKNTSEGLSLIAAGLDWQPGDVLICSTGDFPSNSLPWHQLVPAFVEVREIEFAIDDPEAALIAALDSSTRLVAVSSVRYDCGTRLDLKRLGAACRNRGALLVVDAIQHLGALPLDVSRLAVDFVVAGSHKWMMAPEGLALFWSSQEARRHLKPLQTGWRMWPDMFNFERTDWSIPEHARRFEPGTLNMAGIHGLDASIGLLLETDAGQRADRLLDLVDALYDGVAGLPGTRMLTPSLRSRRAGIVSFTADQKKPAELVAALAGRNIMAARRGPAVRLSPHFYTPESQVAETIEALKAILD